MGETHQSLSILFNLGPKVIMDNRDDGSFPSDEADVAMTAYILQAAKSSNDVIRNIRLCKVSILDLENATAL